LTRVGDLVEIPEIKTVIQLKDLEETHLRRMILTSFVVTEEVESSLRAILTSLSGPEGRGIFLKGHFGSGKSHFLSMLSLLLREEESWPVLLEQAPSLKNLRQNLLPRRYLAVEISLIQHRSTEFLEDIFLTAIFRELSLRLSIPFEGEESRRATFDKIRKTLGGLGFSGLVLLVDELSEFLRSKTDPHGFNEDIRFLQYLGEEASSFPLWIIASLQEWIEETGEINQDTFNKIKDRYPVRITLGRAHVEELVSHRLIRQREGAREKIREIYHSLKRYFPSFPVEESRFLRLYPVHPATIALLDRLKPLFSEHRGIVDFIHYRLKGDGERGIPSFLERPPQELLGPSAIFDHFVDRIREMSETQPFMEKAFSYYEEEIPKIFQDPDQKKVALEAVKLLILFAISPVRTKYTARHMTEMVLFRVTDLETNINYQYFRDILDRLTRESSYLAVSPGKDPLDDQFAVDLKADIPGIMRRKIRQTVAEINPGDRRLFDRLVPLAESPHLPFAGWAERGQQRVSVLWEYTRRNGLILLRQVDEIALAEAESLGEGWKKMEEDFFLIVGTAHGIDRQYDHLRQALLPVLRQKYPGTFLFWVPAAFDEEEESWLRETLAVVLLLDRYRGEESEAGQRGREYLMNFLAGAKKKLGEIFTRAYFSGLLLWDDRQVEVSAYGYLSQEKFLEEFIPPLLSRRFPRHHRIHPYLEALSPTTLASLLRDFFATGMLEVSERTQFGLRTVLDGLLKPMGLLRKRGNQYFLQVDPRHNELAELFLSQLDKGPLPPEALYWIFRKGDYGLLKNQFEALVFALLFSGNAVAYQGARKRGLEEISRTGLQGITTLGKGEILGEDLRRAITQHPLIPDKFRKGMFTLLSQEELWSEIRERKEMETESLQTLLQRVRGASSFQAFRNLPWDSWQQDIKDILSQWEEVKVSFPSREGLERFLSAAGKEPFFSEKLRRLGGVKTFLDHAERVLFVHQYISDPRLAIPDRSSYHDLLEEKRAILRFFEPENISAAAEAIQGLLQRFQDFREKYIRLYLEEHRRARSGDQFSPYEKLRQSRRYALLSRLNQVEMVSVHHNLSSVDRALASVLLLQCNGPSPDALQRSPVCSCGFLLGRETPLPPLREMEEAIDLGIQETLEALKSPTYQERLLPYLSGLEEVGEKEKASAIRRVFSLPPVRDESSFSSLEEVLTAPAVQGINEAFRGKVVIVRRDLDQLYEALIHRKYTLPQLSKIFRDWLKEEDNSAGTFVQFIGKGETGSSPLEREGLASFMEKESPHLLPLLQELGPRPFQKALLFSLWMQGYGIPPREIASFIPILKNEGEERNNLLVRQLAEAAAALREKDLRLFEGMVAETEREEGDLARLWKLLAPQTAGEIFRKEAIFPSILREAFERLLASPPREGTFSEEVGPGGPPSILNAKKKEMGQTLDDYGLLLQKISALKRREGSLPQDFQKWESLYFQTLSPLSFLVETFPATVRRLEVSLPSPAREHLAQAQGLKDSFSQSFSRFYRENLAAWEAGEMKRPRMIEDLPSLDLRKGRSREARKIYLLLDGMRWDLWEYLKEKFFGPRGDQLRIAQEGALWAHLPTSTPRQMELLQGALEKDPGSSAGLEERIWKFGGVDERLHTEKGTLEHLFRNVLQYLELDLAPRLRELPPQSSLVMFSDHGFIENPHFEKTDKYHTSRYTHGEDSPFEVIVPWAVITKIQ